MRLRSLIQQHCGLPSPQSPQHSGTPPVCLPYHSACSTTVLPLPTFTTCRLPTHVHCAGRPSTSTLRSRPLYGVHDFHSRLSPFFHVVSHSRRIGTAYMPSPRLVTISPSYRTAPAAKRVPAASLRLRNPRKSDVTTVAAADDIPVRCDPCRSRHLWRGCRAPMSHPTYRRLSSGAPGHPDRSSEWTALRVIRS